MGVSLQCSIDVLDPSVTEVFKPTREVEEEVKLQNLFRNSIPRTRARIGKTKGKFNKKMTNLDMACRSSISPTRSSISIVKLLDWGEEGHRSDAEIASLRAAFTQEVAVWHKLDNPNVTKFIGATMGSSECINIQTENGHIGMPSNVCCVVVEYCPGGALKSYLIKNMRRKLAFKVVQLALDLARGHFLLLSYLHSEMIVHRDVKTENMLLDKTRTLKIADFGVARKEASNPKDMTRETGTLGYMAPEVLNGSPYNRKCDVYSFGICLWEIYCCDILVSRFPMSTDGALTT
ncbi:serine/threonine-protein kinase 54-like [Euphorbia lathyris]|uniref:serine/threonine-protein kinase 54-like n=1 Tax=Euphorbia lathyris TaxID=212925 RepID=UPI00331434FA